jgi:hypothetical protein
VTWFLRLSPFGQNKALAEFKWAWVVLQLGDLLSTLYVFHLGGYEANPLVARLLPLAGPVGGIFAMKAIGCSIVIPIRSRRVLVSGLVIMSVVLAWNLLIIALGR